jgi:hypothetical protein
VWKLAVTGRLSIVADARIRGWETTERLLESGRYESRQRALVAEPVVYACEAGARWLGLTYWRAIVRLTRGGVRASWNNHGGKLTLLGGPTLLSFGPPEMKAGAGQVSCRHAIRGGLLTLRTGGSVTVAQRRVPEGWELSVDVAEYLPRLTGTLYARGQSPFHASVSRRYFELLVEGAPE